MNEFSTMLTQKRKLKKLAKVQVAEKFLEIDENELLLIIETNKKR